MKTCTICHQEGSITNLRSNNKSCKLLIKLHRLEFNCLRFVRGFVRSQAYSCLHNLFLRVFISFHSQTLFAKCTLPLRERELLLIQQNSETIPPTYYKSPLRLFVIPLISRSNFVCVIEYSRSRSRAARIKSCLEERYVWTVMGKCNNTECNSTLNYIYLIFKRIIFAYDTK